MDRLTSSPVAARRRPGATLAKMALVAILTGGGGPLATEAAAATFTVDPTQIFFSGRTNSAVLTLRNESAEPLRFQLSVFAWNQTESGEIRLDPTEDVVFFPSLLTVEPGQTRRVRVGSAGTAGAREKTYRIFVEEFPPLSPSTNGVRVLTRMGIPIFVRPAKEVATAVLERVRLEDGALRFSLANTGTVHFVPRDIRVAGLTGSATVFERPLEGWYILAGGRRDFDMAIPETQCAQVRSLVVDVLFGSETLRESLQTPAGVCSN